MKLSIVTINYNNAEGLRKTFASVASQTYADIEHIIVDGGSTDGSVAIIEAYASDVARRASGCVPAGGEGSCAVVEGQDTTPADGAQPLATQDTTSPKATQPHKVTWISEPDKGIYNAMNKGLEVALGKRVVNDDHTSQPTPNPFLKEGEHASFAKTWGAHTADSTQYDLLKENAVNNRKNPTEAESVLWDMLKGNKIGYHFRRQHIILDYIVDFICLDKGLIIELDGGYHNDPQQKEYDQARTAHLQRLGYTELRFKNEELLCNPDAVIQKITDTLNNLPSLQGRAGDRLASDYIQILNSGDILAADDVTDRMMAALEENVKQQHQQQNTNNHSVMEQHTITANENNTLSPYRLIASSPIENRPAIFYGNMIKEYPDGRRVKDTCLGDSKTTAKDVMLRETEWTMYDFIKGTINHDPTYIRHDVYEKYGLYDDSLKIVSDWKWFVQAVVFGGEKVYYIPIDVTIFDMTGISETNLAAREKERRMELEKMYPMAVLKDYDAYHFPINQIQRLKRHHLWSLVYFMERILFKLEKWGILK